MQQRHEEYALDFWSPYDEPTQERVDIDGTFPPAMERTARPVDRPARSGAGPALLGLALVAGGATAGLMVVAFGLVTVWLAV